MAKDVPARGDVLITRRAQDGHFEISVVPGDPQFSVRHKIEAVRHAYGFAATQSGLSVWFIGPGGRYTKLAKPRAREIDSSSGHRAAAAGSRPITRFGDERAHTGRPSRTRGVLRDRGEEERSRGQGLRGSGEACRAGVRKGPTMRP